MARITTTVDGKEITLDLDNVFTDEEVRRDYVPKSVLDNETRKYQRLLDKAAKTAADDLLADETFKQKALETWKVDTKGTVTAEQIQQLTQSIRQKEVEPLKEELTKTRGLTSHLLNDSLHRSIEQAARAVGVRDEFLTPLSEGKPAPIVAILSQNFDFGFDAERNTHAVKGANGDFEYSGKPSPSNPYKTPMEAVLDWGKSKEALPFLKDGRQRVGGPTGQQGEPPTGVRHGQSIANDPVAIGNNLEAVAKGKVKVLVSPD